MHYFQSVANTGRTNRLGTSSTECLIHVPSEEWDSSVEKINDFASKFPRLNSLEYGYCSCDMYSLSEPLVPLDWYTRMASQLPKLTRISIKDYLSSWPLNSKVEYDDVRALHQANKQLESIRFTYFRPFECVEIVWKAAPPSVVESSRDAKGRICIWTPQPLHKNRFNFWMDTFGAASIVLLVMSQRWPETSLPSEWELEYYSRPLDP
ncbi:hypothetical protein CPB86DRAFT_391167 [Serendipita vermifera]|nr:hypothetical protein CPB86DRAFT_391167 [Serendipita vermifera]